MSDHENPADELPLPEESGAGLFGDPEPAPSAPEKKSDSVYRVLARKYRPVRLEQLIGQDALVRTLQNAFATGRVAHAFMLTGVRGVGKTTTARIIARGLNCTGPDGKGGPTADPCGVCPNCVAILADRHPDVLEMDAASRTGVDDVREIIEATHFRPIQGRMKVFIIDEVHMLSRNAFNALLKTLEEPPAQVTFIFATTELRKVPVTVLSRCQRFDLRRIAQSELTAFFSEIAKHEHVEAESEALKLIARAADGSVRDGLSLLDQAIAQGSGGADGQPVITAPLVADMLGLSDRSVVFDLFDAVMRGDVPAAIAVSDATYDRGGDPGLMLRDLAELTHTVTRLKTVRDLQDTLDLPESERTRGAQAASSLSVAALSRLWQMLLKGIPEVDDASLRREAAEMVLIRLCYAASLPAPDDLLKRLEPNGATASPAPQRPSGNSSSSPVLSSAPPEPPAARAVNGGQVTAFAAPVQDIPQTEPAQALREPSTWLELVASIRETREASLHGHLRYSTHPVTFAPPLVEIRTDSAAPRDLARRLQAALRSLFPSEWVVREVNEQGGLTLAEKSAEIIDLHKRRSAAHPLVRAIMEAFPGAELGDVRDHTFDDHYQLPPEMDEAFLAPPDYDAAWPEDDD